MKIEKLNVSGNIVLGVCIDSPGGEGHPNMLVIIADKGYIMCGYLNMATADKFEDAAAVIGGKSFEDLLNGAVREVSAKASKLGIKTGMNGKEVVSILNSQC